MGYNILSCEKEFAQKVCSNAPVIWNSFLYGAGDSGNMAGLKGNAI